MGRTEVHELLCILDFNNDRKRMSVCSHSVLIQTVILLFRVFQCKMPPGICIPHYVYSSVLCISQLLPHYALLCVYQCRLKNVLGAWAVRPWTANNSGCPMLSLRCTVVCMSGWSNIVTGRHSGCAKRITNILLRCPLTEWLWKAV